MSGGGGFDPGKDLANLDKDLGLSKNAPLIASAAATFMGVPVDPATMGMVLGAGRAIDKGSISEGINWGLQGYGGASLGAAMAAPAAAAPSGAAIPVETATPVPVGGGAVGPETGGTWFSGAGTPAAGTAPAATAANPYAAMGAEPGGVGGAPWAATNAAAPASNSIAGMFDQATTWYGGLPAVAKYGIPLAAAAMYADRNKGGTPEQKPYDGPLSRLKYDPDRYKPLEVKPPTPYTPVYKDYRNMAGGGLSNIHLPRELGGNNMSAEGEQALLRMFGVSSGAPAQYATPPLNYDPARYDPDIGTKMVARPGMAGGGLADLGDYADYAGGGRMLKGPGDGMSDSIPAVIAGKQPARLANDEFVVPADVVSHLGNGSSDAGAKQLYKMMDKVRSARTGKQAQAKQINPNKYMPA
jgi:hypothetical protein